MNKTVQYVIIAICVLCMLGGLLVAVSSDSVLWRLETLQADLHYALNPPQAVVFVPQGQLTGQPTAAMPTTTLTPTATMALMRFK